MSLSDNISHGLENFKVCHVNVSYILDFVDVDECKKKNGGCEHNCCNTAGGYYCTCNAGYALKIDKKTCAG